MPIGKYIAAATTVSIVFVLFALQHCEGRAIVRSSVRSPGGQFTVVVTDKYHGVFSLDGRLQIAISETERPLRTIFLGSHDWRTTDVEYLWLGHPERVVILAWSLNSTPTVVEYSMDSQHMNPSPDLSVVRAELLAKFKGRPPLGCEEERDELRWPCCRVNHSVVQ